MKLSSKFLLLGALPAALLVAGLLCRSVAGHGPNDENEKENGTEGIKRKP